MGRLAPSTPVPARSQAWIDAEFIKIIGKINMTDLAAFGSAALADND